MCREETQDGHSPELARRGSGQLGRGAPLWRKVGQGEGSRESGKAPGDLCVSCRNSKFLLEASGHEGGVARAWAVETTLWLQRRMNLGGYRDEEVNST